ncbi:MAG: nitrogen regulation protein NR(II) [Dehalococcoidia bacterium]
MTHNQQRDAQNDLGPDLPSWEHFLVERSLDGIVVVDSHGAIRVVNPAAERMFRCDQAAVRGKRIEAFIPQRFRGRHVALRDEFLANQDTSKALLDRDPVPAVRADGEEFLADIALIPILYHRTRGVACVVRDLSERLEAEAAALQAEKLEALRIMSGGVAHDFNNILTTIIANADFLLGTLPDDSPGYSAAADIRVAGGHAAHLIQQMLRFAGRHGTAHTEPADVSEVSREIIEMLRRAVSGNVTLRDDFPAELPPVSCGRVELGQLVMNLVVNASEAIAKSEGEVVVSASLAHVDRRTLRACYGARSAQPGDFVVLEVADTGPGFDRATRARMFDPFFSSKFPGRGLGLASVLGVVQSVGGGLRVQSAPGKGATFRVYLPVFRGDEPPGAEVD